MTYSIRFAGLADAGAIAAIYAPYVRNTAISFEVEPPDLTEMTKRIETVLARYPWLLAEREGRVLGYAYAGEHRNRAAYRWDVDVGIYLAADAHRRGLGRQLYARLFHILRALGLVNAYAGITLPNAGSVGLHEACGFLPVGIYRRVGYKCAAWHDVGWWQLALQAHSDHPAEPRAFAALTAVERQALLLESL
ncbi:MAG: N-acetyltransferase family protein [Stagnimonas sp.]|nr:N-acetyltransferase family protein [Stagnimonas sp.]